MKERKTEHPILFSTTMVQAILALTKFMTRRTKGLEIINQEPNEWNFHPGKVFDLTDNNTLHYHFYKPAIKESSVYIKCPYGQPGDKLWVRETWMHAPNYPYLPEEYYFKASKSEQFLKEWPKSWKPSIHMPKAAARIWLKITGIRVERLQDISNRDAIAEGVEKIDPDAFGFIWKNYELDHDLINCLLPKTSFYTLWVKINGKESFGLNPWVWVIEFKRIEPCQ